jgi:hypothetical protein
MRVGGRLRDRLRADVTPGNLPLIQLVLELAFLGSDAPFGARSSKALAVRLVVKQGQCVAVRGSSVTEPGVPCP